MIGQEQLLSGEPWLQEVDASSQEIVIKLIVYLTKEI